MDHLIRDLQLGFRVLRTNAGFTTIAIVVYGVWLNGYPYGRAAVLVGIRAGGSLVSEHQRRDRRASRSHRAKQD
jgi:energy-converting hydrogenase Eha subunit G